MFEPSPAIPLREGRLIFFDTNMHLDGRAMPDDTVIGDGERWITEATRTELFEKLDPGEMQVVEAGYKTLYFDDLYLQNPGICPVYYWYILSICNPAIIGDRELAEGYFQSRKIKGIPLTDGEQKDIDRLGRTDPRGAEVDPLGAEKTECYRQLEDMDAKFKKKLKRSLSRPSASSLNDIRSFSLMMYHALTTKTDLVLYTGDDDFLPMMLKWLDAVSMRILLINEVGLRLNDRVKIELCRGTPFEFQIDHNEAVRRLRAIFRKLVRTPKNEPAVRFMIRGWDWRNQRLKGDHHLTFNEESANLLARMHGNLRCMGSKNDDYLNWVNITFSIERSNIAIKVERKPLVPENVPMPTVVHQCTCRYRREDASGEMAKWSDFI